VNEKPFVPPDVVLCSVVVAIQAYRSSARRAKGATGTPSRRSGSSSRYSTNAVIATYAPNSCGPSYIDGDNDWVNIDLTAQAGKQVHVQVYDNEANGCGFVSFDHVHMSATRRP